MRPAIWASVVQWAFLWLVHFIPERRCSNIECYTHAHHLSFACSLDLMSRVYTLMLNCNGGPCNNFTLIMKYSDQETKAIKQHTPRQSFLKKWATTQDLNHDILRSKEMLYKLSYWGSSSWLGQITHTKQQSQRKASQTITTWPWPHMIHWHKQMKSK